MMRIKKLIKHDTDHYRNIRLGALSNDPDSFGWPLFKLPTVNQFFPLVSLIGVVATITFP
jgi:hypothetical protein